MGGGGSGGASEKMTPYASTMQHSLSSVSDHKKMCGTNMRASQEAAEADVALQQELCEGAETGQWMGSDHEAPETVT